MAHDVGEDSITVGQLQYHGLTLLRQPGRARVTKRRAMVDEADVEVVYEFVDGLVLRIGLHFADEDDEFGEHHVTSNVFPAGGVPSSIETGSTAYFKRRDPTQAASFETYLQWLRGHVARYLKRSLPPSFSSLEAEDLPEWVHARTADALSMEPNDIILFFAPRQDQSAAEREGIVAYRLDPDGEYVATDALKAVVASEKHPFSGAPLNRKTTRLTRVASVVSLESLQTSLPNSISAADAPLIPTWPSAATENGLVLSMQRGDIVLFFARPAAGAMPEQINEDQGIVVYRRDEAQGTYMATDALRDLFEKGQNPFTRAPIDRDLIRLRIVTSSPPDSGAAPAAKRARLERRRSRHRRPRSSRPTTTHRRRR